MKMKNLYGSEHNTFFQEYIFGMEVYIKKKKKR